MPAFSVLSFVGLVLVVVGIVLLFSPRPQSRWSLPIIVVGGLMIVEAAFTGSRQQVSTGKPTRDTAVIQPLEFMKVGVSATIVDIFHVTKDLDRLSVTLIPPDGDQPSDVFLTREQAQNLKRGDTIQVKFVVTHVGGLKGVILVPIP